MTIEFWAPLGRAWRRMKSLLFQPFDAGRWLVLAFCFWVASLFDGGSGGVPKGSRHWAPGPPGPLDPRDVEEVLRGGGARIAEAWRALLESGAATVALFVVVPMLIALVLALLWVSSRFKMIVIDNLVRGRAEVREPWRQLAPLGDSLFFFRVLFGLAVFVGFGLLVALMVALGVVSFAARTKAIPIAGLAASGFAFLLLAVAVAYAWLFLNSFVEPIMYRDRVPAMAAWRVFLRWFSAEPASFLLYGLFVLLLFIGVGIAIGAVCLLTCCIGFLVIALPFVGTVVLLPLLVAYRYLSLEFLAQFDPGLDVFAGARGGAPPLPGTVQG
jgi:hypothetical protein